MRTVALKRLCTVITRGSAPTYSETSDGTAWAIGQSCQTTEGEFDLRKARWHVGPVPNKGQLQEGDVLINSTGTGTLGRVALVAGLPKIPCFADGHVTMLRVHHRSADPRFLAYVLGLPASREFIEAGLSVGATKQKELSVEALRAHHMQTPARAEQGRIANFLDRECARIDALRRQLGDLRVSLDESERRVIDDLLPTGPFLRLGWLASVRTGLTLGKQYSGELVHRPYLRVANVQADRIDLSEVKTVAVPVSEAAGCTLERSDVLMTEGGDIDKLGRGAVWQGEIEGCLHQNHVFAVRPTARLLPDYLALVTRSSLAREYFEVTAVRSTNLASTSSSKVRAFRFPVPGVERQAAILVEYAGRAASIAECRSELAALDRNLRDYRDALITEAVTGRLDVARLDDAGMDESLDEVRWGALPEVLAS